MEERLIKLFKENKFEELEKELKKLYPQIDDIYWNESKDGDVDLHIVFVKMPYMLPYSGSSYAHFVDLIQTENEEGLENIMNECRVIEKEDIFKQYCSIEFENYYNDLVNRGYDLKAFENLYGIDYNNALWKIIEEIKEKEKI